jgi:hypothetical protein
VFRVSGRDHGLKYLKGCERPNEAETAVCLLQPFGSRPTRSMPSRCSGGVAGWPRQPLPSGWGSQCGAGSGVGHRLLFTSESPPPTGAQLQ